MTTGSDSQKISLVSYDPRLLAESSSTPTTKLIPLSKIQSVLLKLLQENPEKIFDSQKKAFCLSTQESKDAGVTSSLPIQTAGQTPQPEMKSGSGAQVCIKTGYTYKGDKMVSKVAAGGGDNGGNTGVVFVFDQTTLRLESVLCDEGLLTEVRTAAACSLASSVLLGDQRMNCITKIGIIGGGVQAIWQLRLLGALIPKTSCRNVVVKTRSIKSAQTFIEHMKNSAYPPDREWSFEHYQSPESGGYGFKKCELIHTLTPSREPVLSLDDVNISDRFLHVTAVGADSPGKTELDSDLIKKADKLYCDSIPQTKFRGEYQKIPEVWESLCEIGSFIQETEKREYGFTIFDSSGVPAQDLEMASLVSSFLDNE